MSQSPGSRELLTILAQADDPVTLAILAAARFDDLDERAAFVEDAAKTFGRPLTVRAMQGLERHARVAAALPGAADSANRLVSDPSPAARWLGAMLLDAQGQHDQACRTIETIEGKWNDEYAMRSIVLARTLGRSGHTLDAWRPLRDSIRLASSQHVYRAAGRVLQDLQRDAIPPHRATRRIAVVGSGTLQFWVDALRPALFAFGIHAEIFTGEFGQYEQEIRDPASPLASFGPDLIVLAVDHRALGLPPFSEEPGKAVDDAVQRFTTLWTICRERFAATIVQCNFEVPDIDASGRLSTAASGGRGRVLHRLNVALWEAAERARVAMFDIDAAAGAFGKTRWHSESLWIAAKQYPSADALPFLARRLAAVVRAACGLTSKCVVLDLDNTLWGGVIGEDGLAGIRLGGDPEGEAFLAFQLYLQELRSRGIALAVCSKNNDEDARAVFRQHPETVLHETDFAVFCANWQPKPDNIRRIAAALNIGLDSLVFVDDNPAERSFIRRELREVEVPELPDDPALFPAALAASGLFEAWTLTDEDRGRADSYGANAQRVSLAGRTADVDSYLHQLQMRLELRPFGELDLPRIVQLINKTNQFNLTTRRATDADVRRWMEDVRCYTQAVRVRDRFGDSGLTGVLIAVPEEDTLAIHSWLLSCRVLGRRIEHVMLGSLIAHASASGYRALRGQYLATAKNEQVRTLYDRLGFTPLRVDADGRDYELPLAGAAIPSAEWFEIDDRTMVRDSVQADV